MKVERWRGLCTREKEFCSSQRCLVTNFRIIDTLLRLQEPESWRTVLQMGMIMKPVLILTQDF